MNLNKIMGEEEDISFNFSVSAYAHTHHKTYGCETWFPVLVDVCVQGAE